MWETEAGDQILIKDLTDGHLVNILNHIKRNQLTYPAVLYDFMENEAYLRKMRAFTTKKAMPVKLNNGEYALLSEEGVAKSTTYNHDYAK